MSDHYETDRSLLGAHLAANWSACPIALQNQAFTPPTPTGSQSAPAFWISFTVEYPEPQQQLTFDGTEQKIGAIKHGIFLEQDRAEAKTRQIADDLRDLWATFTSSGFTVFPKNCHLEPPLSDDTWDMHLLVIPFWRAIPGA